MVCLVGHLRRNWRFLGQLSRDQVTIFRVLLNLVANGENGRHGIKREPGIDRFSLQRMAVAKVGRIEELRGDSPSPVEDQSDSSDQEGEVGLKLRLSNEYVKLNVGGSLFQTTVGTLCKRDGMLRAMFSGRMEVHKDEAGVEEVGCIDDRAQ